MTEEAENQNQSIDPIEAVWEAVQDLPSVLFLNRRTAGCFGRRVEDCAAGDSANADLCVLFVQFPLNPILFFLIHNTKLT